MVIYQVYMAVALAFATLLLYRLFRCHHGWELVDKTEFPSLVEAAAKLGHTVNNISGMDTVQSCFEKKVVLVMRCPKCGTAKILTLKG